MGGTKENGGPKASTSKFEIRKPSVPLPSLLDISVVLDRVAYVGG